MATEGKPSGWRVIRCPSRKHGIAAGAGWLRMRCFGANCRGEGQATFHTWNLETGECVETERVPKGPAASFRRD